VKTFFNIQFNNDYCYYVLKVLHLLTANSVLIA